MKKQTHIFLGLICTFTMGSLLAVEGDSDRDNAHASQASTSGFNVDAEAIHSLSSNESGSDCDSSSSSYPSMNSDFHLELPDSGRDTRSCYDIAQDVCNKKNLNALSKQECENAILQHFLKINGSTQHIPIMKPGSFLGYNERAIYIAYPPTLCQGYHRSCTVYSATYAEALMRLAKHVDLPAVVTKQLGEFTQKENIQCIANLLDKCANESSDKHQGLGRRFKKAHHDQETVMLDVQDYLNTVIQAAGMHEPTKRHFDWSAFCLGQGRNEDTHLECLRFTQKGGSLVESLDNLRKKDRGALIFLVMLNNSKGEIPHAFTCALIKEKGRNPRILWINSNWDELSTDRGFKYPHVLNCIIQMAEYIRCPESIINSIDGIGTKKQSPSTSRHLPQAHHPVTHKKTMPPKPVVEKRNDEDNKGDWIVITHPMPDPEPQPNETWEMVKTVGKVAWWIANGIAQNMVASITGN